jgi:hypothetical protein
MRHHGCITTPSAPHLSAKRIGRFRQRGSDELGPGPIARGQLSPRVREKLERIRREDTLNWMAHSAWVSAWATLAATLVVVAGLGATVGFFLGAIHPVVAQANTGLVLSALVTTLVVSLAAGALAYPLARLTHPTRITRGRPLPGPLLGLALGAAVALVAAAVAMPWSFPRSDVLLDSASQVQTLAADHQIVQGTVLDEPYGSSLYFEVTIGAWVETPVSSSGFSSIYSTVVNAAGPNPFARPARVADAVGSHQTAALRDWIWHEWMLAAALALGAMVAGVAQRKRWEAPLLAPPVADDIVRQVWQADREGG